MTTTMFPSETELQALLVGPESVTWRTTSDVRLYAVMLYPLLLQVAHPTVGAGVRDYSDFEHRPWDRLMRTLDYVNLLVYGGYDAAAAGRRLRALHKGFRGLRENGERYSALEPGAYAWVHATLLETYVAGHAHFGAPMSAAEIDRFYSEYRGLGRLIGVREQDLPPSWPEFRAYFDQVVREQLQRTDSVDRVLRTMTQATRPPIKLPEPVWRAARVPASRLLWLGGLGLMDPGLRGRLGVGWSSLDDRSFRAVGAISRGLQPVLPERMKVMGPAHLRWRRREIEAGPLGEPSRVAA